MPLYNPARTIALSSSNREDANAKLRAFIVAAAIVVGVMAASVLSVLLYVS